jgi:anti-anti-sigma regulatory factor
MSSSSSRLSCDFDAQHSRHVVVGTGEIMATVRPIRERVSSLDGDVAIDCQGVTFLDSAGVGLFIGGARRRGANMVTARPFAKLNTFCFNVLEPGLPTSSM